MSCNTVKVNDDVYTPTFTESTFTTSNPIYVGHINSSNSPKIKGKLYSFEVVGKAKLIPAKKISTNEVGMYDTISKKFYPATGTMTIG